VARVLGLNVGLLTASERPSFENFALVLNLVPDLRSWTRDEKDEMAEIIRSKSKANEMRFLRLTQRHNRFRKALLKLGS
jgi:hypothetical protein